MQVITIFVFRWTPLFQSKIITFTAHEFKKIIGNTSCWSPELQQMPMISVQKTNSDITLYYSVNPDGKSVAVAPGPEKYNCSDLEIPAQVTNNGTTYNVTKIGANAFERATINMDHPTQWH